MSHRRSSGFGRGNPAGSTRGGPAGPARRRRLPARLRHRRQQGLILLSVLLVIMMGTTVGFVSLRDGQRTLRTVGMDRHAEQGRYAAEGIAMGMLAWFDRLNALGIFNEIVFEQWGLQQQNGCVASYLLPFQREPAIPMYGDPANIHNYAQVTTEQMRGFQVALETGAVTRLDDGDPTPTIGARDARTMAPAHVVDLLDCVEVKQQTVGEDQAAKQTNAAEIRRLCTMIVRSRMNVLALEAQPMAETCDWGLPQQGCAPDEKDTYTQVEYVTQRDAVAIIETPPFTP